MEFPLTRKHKIKSEREIESGKIHEYFPAHICGLVN